MTRIPNRYIGRISPSYLGKIVDNPKNKPGSRADQYWGKLSTPDEVNKSIKKFGIHSFEWGNWVNMGEREEVFIDLNNGLRVLSNVMNIPQKRIGFGKRLSISFGSRGRGGRALATYHPNIHHINITKPNGYGSLAHEYGHSIDYEAGRKLGFAPSGGDSVFIKQGTRRKGGKIVELYDELFETLYYKNNGAKTNFAIGLMKSTSYWRQRNEIWARTFEAWVKWKMLQKGLKSNILTASSYDHYVYPNVSLLKKVDPIIRKIIYLTIGKK